MSTTTRSVRASRTTLNALLRGLSAYGPDASARKAAVLRALIEMPFASARDLRHLQRAACFLRAFPDDAAVHDGACRLAASFEARVRQLPARERRSLEDSGIAGTVTRYRYPAVAARWLAQRAPHAADIDWPALDDPEALGLTVASLLNPLEDEVTDFSGRGFERWLRRARGAAARQESAATTEGAGSKTAATPHGSDLGWLLAQAPAGPTAATFDREYNAATVPVAWHLSTSTAVAQAVVPGPMAYRRGLRRAEGGTAAIREPLTTVQLLPRHAARRLLDAWRTALWARARTIFQIEQVDDAACRLADFGEGLTMAIAGVPPPRRSPLEVTYGYLLLANGMPVGYGGFTTLFAQVNTGINVFPEFRGSEAAFAWQQALRTMRSLTGCARLVINPFQFGADNREALTSGAYWFHYRLGFRSADPAVRQIADREAARMARRPAYRVPLAALRRLAGCDLRLDLDDDAADRYVDESALEALGQGITTAFAREGTLRRSSALTQMTRRLAAELGVDLTQWSPPERQGLALLAPLVAQVADLAAWPAADRQALAELCRLRTAPDELPFVRRLRDHARFRQALTSAARAAADGEPGIAPRV